MTASEFRNKLRTRQFTIGSWVQVSNGTSAEILGRTGFDWIGIDMEHTDIDVEALAHVIRGMYGRNVVPIVRLKYNDVIAIRRALDLGAQGILVPLVGTAEDARAAVGAAKYPPEGIRGFSYCRANNWGVDFDAYVSSANADISVIAMIETKEGVENIEEILSVEGVDGVFVGPYDMSGSYGIPGQLSHSLVRDACRRICAVCKQLGKSAGLHIIPQTLEAVQNAVEDGFTLICNGIDTVFLSEGARRALAIAQQVIAEAK